MMILAVSALHRLRCSLVNRPIPNREDIFLPIEKYQTIRGIVMAINCRSLETFQDISRTARDNLTSK